MSIFLIYLFVLAVGLGVIAYLLLTNKDPLWQEHSVHPDIYPASKSNIEEGSYSSQSWTIKSAIKEFKMAQDQIYNLSDLRQKPSRGESFGEFFSYVVYSVNLMWKEKEIFTFALLQWAFIGLGYYLWVQMLSWIPAEVWRAAEASESASIADVILWVWSFFCVGVVAYPLGILTACMGAVHFIHRQGRSSSIAECFKMVLPRVWALWIFTWTDSWITVNQILDRLPKKNDRRTPAQRALGEALYYAWKIGTIGILPGLITGRGLIESCRQSIDIVRHKFKEVAKLRVAYSALCWVVGISAYVGTIFFFIAMRHLLPARGQEIYGHIYTFYFLAGVPILIAVSIIQIILRPIYVISSCHLYSDYLNEKEERIILPHPPSKGLSSLVVFLILAILLVVVILLREQLGITRLLATLS